MSRLQSQPADSDHELGGREEEAGAEEEGEDVRPLKTTGLRLRVGVMVKVRLG